MIKKRNYSIRVGGDLMTFDIPRVMGIINVTPDSFYSGSRCFDAETVKKRVEEMRLEGADIIDIGGYSSRPGAADVDPEEEYRRLAEGLAIIRDIWENAVVSVDTFRADVARRCVEDWSVNIINDIGGGTLDRRMWETIADLGVAYVLMHTRGTPKTMGQLTEYDDVTADVLKDLAFKTDKLREMGVADIIVDPGFGFAKTVGQNFKMLAELDIFHEIGAPVLAGVSRKTMIWKTLGITPEESGDGTQVLDTVALMNGADILRVHDVKPAVQAVKLISALKSSIG